MSTLSKHIHTRARMSETIQLQRRYKWPFFFVPHDWSHWIWFQQIGTSYGPNGLFQTIFSHVKDSHPLKNNRFYAKFNMRSGALVNKMMWDFISTKPVGEKIRCSNCPEVLDLSLPKACAQNTFSGHVPQLFSYFEGSETLFYINLESPLLLTWRVGETWRGKVGHYGRGSM